MHMPTYYAKVLIAVWILLALIDIACGHTSVTAILSAEDRFALGKMKYNNRDFLEAINEFEVVRLQFPGSTIADSAQYYLGECHYQQDEFLLAAEEYQTLRRNMPASSLVPLAQYKIALCYYNLSPKAPLDQSYTRRAIDEFQAFIEYYPNNELLKDAETKIVELNSKLAQKLFESGQLYLKMNNSKGALIYYDLVIEKYHDTPFAELALLGKVKALIARKRYDEAKSEIEKYFDKYPSSSNRRDAEMLQKDIEDHLKSKSAIILHMNTFEAQFT
jgi:outer membrane protein assembly factor BamD